MVTRKQWWSSCDSPLFTVTLQVENLAAPTLNVPSELRGSCSTVRACLSKFCCLSGVQRLESIAPASCAAACKPEAPTAAPRCPRKKARICESVSRGEHHLLAFLVARFDFFFKLRNLSNRRNLSPPPNQQNAFSSILSTTT